MNVLAGRADGVRNHPIALDGSLYEPQSNGSLGGAMRTDSAEFKASRSALENRCGGHVPDYRPILTP